MPNRPTREQYYMDLAFATAKRSTCDRAQVGAIAVKDKRIIATGYNGSPSGLPHCSEVGHQLLKEHCIRTVHAEQNIICQCAKDGVALKGATIYCTHQPCFDCLKLLISAGVKAILFDKFKPDNRIPNEFYDYITMRRIAPQKEEQYNE